MSRKVSIKINPNEKISHINKEIYGHFSEHLGRCIYNGIFVGENSEIPNTNGVRNDIIAALRDIKIPVLRWPGGCFADEYHWKDGVGEKSSRKKMVNTNWGGVTEDNSFGTNEFMNLCEVLGCEPYIAGNLGSGTIQELSEWVEYMTMDGQSPMADERRKNGREKPWKLKYLGIGNENWGCGGNMRPEFYADEYRRYQTFCKNYSGNELFKIACGPSGDDYNWTEVLASNLTENHTKALSLHYYTIPTGDWSKKGFSTEFSDEEYYSTLKSTRYIDEIITKHSEILHKHDSKIKLIIDEWGCWYDVEPGTNPGFLYQQNTMRDAIVAAINLNIFNKHSSDVIMANLAQVVNVLQAVILTDGKNMLLTPTYYVFKLFCGHQEAELVQSAAENGGDMLTESASVDKDGNLLVTAANCSLDEKMDMEIDAHGFENGKVTIEYLHGGVREYNDFAADEAVTIKPFTDFTFENGVVRFTAEPVSVFSVRISK